jgi:prepilin-type N-terminal cleavage/methylation domain-containing protein
VPSSAFTLIEMLVVIGIIGILVALLIPVIQSTRESARRTACITRIRNLVLALQLHQEAIGKLPPSAFFKDGKNLDEALVNLWDIKPGDTAPGSLAPYSFFVKLLPHLENAELFEQINRSGHDAFAPANIPIAARNIPVLNCPAYSGPSYSSALEYAGSNPAAIANYKSLGATTLSCLQDGFAARHELLNGGTLHPYATYRLDTLKAPTQTVVLAETKEEKYAAWFDGTTAAIPAFSPATGNDTDDRNPTPPIGKPGLNVGGKAPAAPFCTVAQWKDVGTGGIAEPMEWGPSSEHPGVVNHAFAGTEARPLSIDIDPTIYRAMVSRQAEDNKDVGEGFK